MVVERDVRDMLADYGDATETKGLLAEFTYLDSSAQFAWMPPGFSSPIDFDSVAVCLRTNAPLIRSISWKWAQLNVLPLNDTLAYYYGRLSSTTTLHTDSVLTTGLLESGLWVRRGPDWKLLAGHTSEVK